MPPSDEYDQSYIHLSIKTPLIIISWVVIRQLGVTMSDDEEKETPMAECGSCRAIISLDSSECGECGIKFSGVSDETLGECGACNSLVAIESKSCPDCGVFFVADDVMDVLREWFSNMGIEPEQLFSKFDSDSDGSIDAEELRDGLLKMNLADLPPSQIERLINEVDADSDGVISLSELVAAITGEEVTPAEEEIEETPEEEVSKSVKDYSDNVVDRIIKKFEIEDKEKFLAFANSYDENGNDYLTEAELKKAATDYVSAQDSDSDAEVEVDEEQVTDDSDSTDSEEETVDDANDIDDDTEEEIDEQGGDEEEAQTDIEEETELDDDSPSTEKLLENFAMSAKAEGMTIREIFETMDTDDSGMIDGPELQKGIISITGESLSPGEIYQIIEILDKDSDGRVNPFELIEAIEELGLDIESDKPVKKAAPIEVLLQYLDESGINPASIFSSLDSNNDGKIDREEMRVELHSRMGDSIGEDDIDELMDSFDDDGDGHIDLIEFISTLEDYDEDVDESASLSSAKEFPSKWQKRMMSKKWKDVVWPLVHSGFVLFMVLWIINGTLAPFVDGESGMVELDSEFGQAQGADGTSYLDGDTYPCDNDVQVGGCKNSFTPLAGENGEISMPAGFYWDGIFFIILGAFGLIGSLFTQMSLVSGWRARARALKEDSADRKEVKKTVTKEEVDSDAQLEDDADDDSEEGADDESEEDVGDDQEDEIDIGSHIGLILDDEEVYGVIIEFDDEEGLVTIEEDGTADLVTGYQDDMFLED